MKNSPPAHVFIWRLAACTAIAGVLAAFALLTGVVGYHSLAGLGWIDALLNASMILGGMGPVDTLTNRSAKFSPLATRSSADLCSSQ